MSGGPRTSFPYPIDVVEHLWIPLADGTRLAARLWRPVGVERAPVVLEYLPYRKGDGTDIDDATRHAYFAGFGFVSVRVDIRGSGDSDGLLTDEYTAAEIADGVEVIGWLAAQSWSNGRVGLMGISWGGFNALQIAAVAPPALAAIVTACSTDDRFADDVHYVGGAVLARDMPGWAATLLAFNAQPPDPAIAGAAWREQWLERVAATPAFVDAWLLHRSRDDYWRHGSVCENYAAIRCPVLVVGGWADGYPNAALRLVERLPGVRRGIVGPWAHQWPHAGRPGPRIGFLQECVRWWRQWLADEDARALDAPLLRAFIEEPGPSQSALRPGRWLGGGHETRRARVRLSAIRVRPDLGHGEASPAWCPFGPGELAPIQTVDDGRSAWVDVAIDADAVLLGRPVVEFRALDPARRGHLVVRLCEVDRSGTSELVSWGVGRLTDGRVELKAVGRRLVPGHRLRVAFARSYWPLVWPARDLAPVDIDEVTLVLPKWDGEEVPPFGAPESASPGAMTVLTDGGARRVVATGRLERTTDSGSIRHGNGIAVRFVTEDRLALDCHDAETATVACMREVHLARDAWYVDIRVNARMAAAGDDFAVDVALDVADERGAYPTRNWRMLRPRPPE